MLLGFVKNSLVKELGDLAPELDTVGIRGASRAPLFRGLRRSLHGSLLRGFWKIKRGGRVDVHLVAVQGASRCLEDGLHPLELRRRNVDGELGVLDADKLGVDAKSTVEPLADELPGGAILDAIADRLGQRRLPLGNTGQKGDVFAGEVAEGREFLKRRRVALQDVLERAHGEDALLGIGGFDGADGGLAAAHQGVDGCGSGIDRLGAGARVLVLSLPLRDRVQGLLTESRRLHNLPTGQENSQNLQDQYRDAYPTTALGDTAVRMQTRVSHH